MAIILAALIALGALMNALLGFGFLLDPATMAVQFGFDTASAQGMSTTRGDMTAFFLVAAAFMAWGAWKRRGDVLLPALGLFAIAFAGRLVNLLIVGTYDMWWEPMLVEAGHVIVLALAIRYWPRATMS